MELTCTYSCCSEGMVAVLHNGYTDSPKEQTVRDIIKMVRDREETVENRDMLRKVLGMLAARSSNGRGRRPLMPGASSASSTFRRCSDDRT